MSQKNLLSLACCLAIIISCALYLLLCAAGNGTLTIVETDQPQYMQYARNIAQGHPYIYSTGDSPSTGCTSHLYPFILALFYKLGAHGNNFVIASFILNAFFYLGIALLSGLIAKKIYPKAAPLALFIPLISGHTVSAVFGQTDIGFFTFLTLSLIASTVYEKKPLMLLLIFLCSITRPEGAIYSIAFLSTGIIGLHLKRKHKNPTLWPKSYLLCGLTGITAFGLTILLNTALTGYGNFMSVMNKGYFNNYPFFGAIELTLFDLLALIKGFFFGIPNTSRQFYHFPLVSGFFGIAGILLYPRKNKNLIPFECWLILSVLGALGIIASSRFQGLSHDRYLSWVFQLWSLYILIGVFELGKKIKSRYFTPISCTCLMLFQLISLVYFGSSKYAVALHQNRQKNFAELIDHTLEKNARLGSTVGASITYYIPERKIYNLSGINSPDFFDAHYDLQSLRIIDRLKHRPDLRFEYWLANTQFSKKSPWAIPFMESPTLIDTDSAIGSSTALAVYPTKWDSLLHGNMPTLLTNQIANLQLVDSLDIGYAPAEAEHKYSIDSRIQNAKFPLCYSHTKLGEQEYSELGRIVMGSDSFLANNLTTKKPLYLIMRTTKSTKGICISGNHKSTLRDLEMSNLLLEIKIDNQVALTPQAQVEGDDFTELIFKIPAPFITHDKPRITISGDHIAYAYWLYQ